MKLLAAAGARIVVVLVLCIGSTAVADLSADVETILQDKLLHKANVGIDVIRLGHSVSDSKTIFELNSTTPLTPASNLKLATTSAALDRLSPDFKFRTVLLLHDGDVILIGDGDPTFGDLEYLKKAGWGITTVFENWAAQLKKLGVDHVGKVIIDDSVFDEDFSRPHWPAGQWLQQFEAGIGGLNLNTNFIKCTIQATAVGQPVKYVLEPPTQFMNIRNGCVTGDKNAVTLTRPIDSNDVTLGGETRAGSTIVLTMFDPPMFAGTVLAETLQSSGIRVASGVARDRTARMAFDKAKTSSGKWTIVGIHETPLQPVLARANKDSVNLYAECLCKRLGNEATHAPGTWANGTAAVGTFLQKTGVKESEFALDDGSGLSRDNRISPHALAQILAYNYHSKNSEIFFNTLSVAGVDGTLDDRFRLTELRDLQKRVFGKSGFIEGVSTLSGYLHAKDDQWYVFSIMMNGIPRLSNSQIKVLQERIIHAIDTEIHAAAIHRTLR